MVLSALSLPERSPRYLGEPYRDKTVSGGRQLFMVDQWRPAERSDVPTGGYCGKYREPGLNASEWRVMVEKQWLTGSSPSH